ncbi:hypothetical protein ACFLWS_00265 [Chloroflexota bacterium]
MFLQNKPEQSWQKRHLERREFLKGMISLGALAFLSSFIPACLRESKQASKTTLPTTPSNLPIPSVNSTVPTEGKTVIGTTEAVATQNWTPMAILYRDEVNEYRFGMKRVYSFERGIKGVGQVENYKHVWAF